MTQTMRPLILFTNDDGIQSPGLWASVRAFEGMGDLLVVAPAQQQSGMGRSMPAFSTGTIEAYALPTAIRDCKAYSVDGTPAQAVQHGILELADRQPALVVSGINYGENTGNGVTISGTVGAAIEASSLGVHAIASSLQTPIDLHLTYSDEVDFDGAAYFNVLLGRFLLNHKRLPDDVDVLKIDVPWGATSQTPWRITRLSRRRVYWPTPPERRVIGDTGKLGYRLNADPAKAEPDSDVYAVMHDKVVAVTPISLDMSARTDYFRLRQIIDGEEIYGGD